MSGSIPCGSRQARAGDLGAAAREGTTRGPTATTLDACLPGRARRVPIFFHGVNLLKAGSWTQATRSLSAALGVLRRSQRRIDFAGAKSMMIDFGEDVGQCVLGTVNSSAKSVMERRGAGRIGHLHCVMPWLQERVDSGEIRTWNERESRTRRTPARRRRLQQDLENI